MKVVLSDQAKLLAGPGLSTPAAVPPVRAVIEAMRMFVTTPPLMPLLGLAAARSNAVPVRTQPSRRPLKVPAPVMLRVVVDRLTVLPAVTLISVHSLAV